MYAGLFITKMSGGLLGAHQRINRRSRTDLDQLVDAKNFPSIRLINNFEGKNGPDAIKLKSPSVDEPWHFYDPFNSEDNQLIDIIEEHYSSLVAALKSKNNDKAAFEAAWLSHALVDGLTPAHHYPFEEELEEIRGEAKETRKTKKERFMASGDKTSATLKKNWMLWGAKGLFTTHHLFEFGVAMIMAPGRIKKLKITEKDLIEAKNLGISELFASSAREIAQDNMYQHFYTRGWTLRLSNWVRNRLAPEMIKVTTIVWYLAIMESGAGKKK